MQLHGMKMKIINGAIYFYDTTKIIAIIKSERSKAIREEQSQWKNR